MKQMRNQAPHTHSEPSIAPGIGESDELNRPATEEEMKNHDTTCVTRLYLDEADPSGEDRSS